MPALALALVALLWSAAVQAADPPTETAAESSSRALLDALEERQMPDVTLAVLARIEADPEASQQLKREAAFRRAAALIGVSKTEADAKKRAAMLDDAQTSLEAFLKSGTPTDRQAIAAYTQMGSLLVERGRSKVDQAARPGADAKALGAEAIAFFDAAIKNLQGTAEPGKPIDKVTNAEDAVLKVLREVDAQIAAIKSTGKDDDKEKDKDKGDKDKPADKAKPLRLKPAQRRQLEALEAEQEALRGKLIQTRLTTAAAVFEKAKAYPEKSKERTDTLTKSSEMFKAIADKYSTKGGGIFARFYEGRNYAMLEQWSLAANTLLPLTLLEDRIPLAIRLRCMALNTTLECFLAEKKFDQFDLAARKFALEDVARLPGASLDADWLGLKYRAAKILDLQADAIDPKDPKSKGERARLQSDAKKLAVEVARANADFADEARELAAKLGKVVAEGEQTFAGAMDEARVSLTTMQAKLAEAKAAAAAKDAAREGPARSEAAAARDDTVAKLETALKLAGIAAPLAADAGGDDSLAEDVTIDDVNQARYLLTYLLYDARRFPEAAALGRMLAERYPNAKGSRQAAKIAMASWQQAGQEAEGEAREAARGQAAELAGIVMKTWPDEAESADAAVIAISTAAAARDPKSIASIIGQIPSASPRRAEVLLRAGVALWREVQEARRLEAEVRPPEATLTGWKQTATQALDDGLAALADATSLPPAPVGSLAIAGALSRVQIAMEDDDDARAAALLKQPVYGPWTLVSGDKAVLKQGPLAEAALTLALRLFIQTEDFDSAQQAMAGLEKAAGQGDEASAKLTAMYLSMGRDLQSQLESLGGDGKPDPKVAQRARKILGGFEKFLDGVAARDPKTSSQIWVATTYLTLGSGKGTGAVVPAANKASYLQKSADVYAKLLARRDEPEVGRFEPSIRLRMANIYQELGDWKNAREQMDWILADAKRQNSLEAQISAAEILQAAGMAAAEAGDAEQANTLLREAAGGRRGDPVVVWGWGNIANKLARQGLSGAGEKAQQNRDAFFNARLRVVECLLARAKLPGKERDRDKRLETAETAIAITRKLYPDLGGDASANRYERLLKEVQKERGKAADGFKALDEQGQAAASPVEVGAGESR